MAGPVHSKPKGVLVLPISCRGVFHVLPCLLVPRPISFLGDGCVGCPAPHWLTPTSHPLQSLPTQIKESGGIRTETYPSGLVCIRSLTAGSGQRPSNSSGLEADEGPLTAADLGLDHPLPWNNHFDIQPDLVSRGWVRSQKGGQGRQQRWPAKGEQSGVMA